MPWNKKNRTYHDDWDPDGGVDPDDLKPGHHYFETTRDKNQRLVYQGDDECPHPYEFDVVDSYNPSNVVGRKGLNNRELGRLTEDDKYNDWYDGTHRDDGTPYWEE